MSYDLFMIIEGKLKRRSLPYLQMAVASYRKYTGVYTNLINITRRGKNDVSFVTSF